MTFNGRVYLSSTTATPTVLFGMCTPARCNIVKKTTISDKHIDRIAQKAEAAQRFAKGGHWK
ncbi:hypothetical protein M0R72_07070 [Candidatus Pacearchaeota archaeon]|jgi:replicative superfamily II helicase|nr:hypothetical protein [Candidatus Pacearchaeota archaeon]